MAGLANASVALAMSAHNLECNLVSTVSVKVLQVMTCLADTWHHLAGM